VKVPYDEGRAYRIGPESCVSPCEGRHEAFAGERAGQVLSYETKTARSADAVRAAEGNMTRRASASSSSAPRSLRPWHVRKLLAREPGDLTFGRTASAGRSASGRPEGRSR
jgi:hypothetical protein